MTLDQIIERLTEYREELGGDTEVKLMTQQNWPFENTITGLCSGQEINDHWGPEEDDVEDDEDVEDDVVVYIVEGEQIGYGSKRAWEVAS